MPIRPSTYKPPLLLSSGHLQTLFGALIRRVPFSYDRRERIDTPDDDFLDLDWADAERRDAAARPSPKVAILTHGMEGSSDGPYVRGMARALTRRGWDVCAWNLRGCSGEPNRKPETYHSGKTEDIACVTHHVLECGYDRVVLVGFSLGGNLTLKYLGERRRSVDDRIRGAVTFSVPVDLEASARRLGRPTNLHYRYYFLRSLKQKIRQKAEQLPAKIQTDALDDIQTIRDFDDAYTAPLNGFRGAGEYYTSASSKSVLPDIGVPTLLVNAVDDPFLADSCYPEDAARDHPHLTLEMPNSGGHVGFVSFSHGDEYWSERRATSFLGTHCIESAGAVAQ